ncbi:MAG: hypothetical protein ACKOAU_21005 [Pirellula sp.]
MLKASVLGITMFIVASLQVSVAEAGDVTFFYGWGSEIHTIGDVEKDSLIGQEMGDKRLSVAHQWEQLWLAVPLWCSGRQFIIHEKVDYITDQTKVWVLKDQSPKAISKLTGVPESELAFPFYAYIPNGWLILGGIALIVRLISGRSPNKEFAKLIQDDRYKRALEIVMTPITSISEDTEPANEVSDVEEQVAVQNRYVAAVTYLTSQGISESNAERNLQFLIGYINSRSQLESQLRK